MNRRNLITAAVALGAPSQGATIKNAIFELRYYRMRNSAQIQRTTDFLGKHYMPAAQRAGFGPMGFFNQLIADQGPFVLALTSYPGIADIETGMEKMKSDKEFQKGLNEYDSMTELSYIRMESSLLRAFDSIPGIEIPPGDPKRAAAYLRTAYLRIEQRKSVQNQDQNVRRRRNQDLPALRNASRFLWRNSDWAEPA